MNQIMLLAAENTLAALCLALLIYGLTRFWRHPPLEHLAWLLVLVKLVAPPLIAIDRPAPPPAEAALRDGLQVAGETQFDTDEPAPTPALIASTADIAPAPLAVIGDGPRLAVSLESAWARLGPIVFGLWLAGAGLWALVTAVRTVRFGRMLGETLPAPERVQRLTAEIAAKLEMRSVPAVRYVDSVAVPLVWWVGRRPTIALPIGLVAQWDDEQLALVLAHELAHLRRHDHWVRAIELIVSCLYWWNPLVWPIRRQLHRAEDVCCDAWVRWAFPDCPSRYAELMLRVAESLSPAEGQARLLPASQFLRSHSLKGRIEMILENRFAPGLSKKSVLAVALLAIVVLPSVIPSAQTPTVAADAENSAQPPAAAANPGELMIEMMKPELPYTLKFEQGAARFSDGDKITIREVRGTADTFARGNIYCVRGTYTLASRDRAILLASATVTDRGSVYFLRDFQVRSDFFTPGLGRDPGNVTGVELTVQRADVTRGTGNFTLFFTTPFGGLPHVSFCSVEKGGDSFGGTYFGAGDSVLKEWWDTRPIPKTPDPPANTEYSHVVKFELGTTQFSGGDKITIEEIRGTSETFTPGNFYQIKGTYSLSSHDHAKLAAYTTAKKAADGRSIPSKVQSTDVDRGDGTFTLILPMACEGWPHVSFYSGGGSSGGVYFGTGESVRRDDREHTFAAPDRQLKLVTIEKAYWKESAEAPAVVRELKWSLPPGCGRFFIHCREWLDNAGDYRQYKQFMRKADPIFVLRAEGQSDVECQVTQNCYTDRSKSEKLCELDVIIPAAEYAKMVADVAYTLHPANGKEGYEWKVGDKVTLTRQ